MRVTFALTSRLVMITTVSTVTIVAMLVMLGFELGLRQAHEDFAAQARARGESPAATSGQKSSLSYSPVVLPSASTVLYSATNPSKGK